MKWLPAARAFIVLSIVGLTVAPACGGETHMQAPSIREAKKAHEAELMAMPGVVSVGIGRDAEGRAVIVIGLDRERPATLDRLPSRLEGYEVRTELVGEVKASDRSTGERER